MLYVISPAKSLDFDSEPSTNKYSQPVLLAQSQDLIETLRLLTPADIASLMKISDKLAILNCQRFNDWEIPFTPDNAKQAVLAFSGDVYSGLDAMSLTESNYDYAQVHLRILSGLYGVLKPLDLIQAYRLEMGTKLKNAKGSNLYQFWQDTVTEQLNLALSASNESILVNLASNEYFKSVQPNKLNAEVITPVFKDCKGGKYKIISFYAKKARGMMVRYLIENQVETLEQLQLFDSAGYYYCDAESSSSEFVFKREELFK